MAAVVVIGYAPDAVGCVARTHEVEESYLQAHRTPDAFRVFETDVARWLSLRGPGVLYEIVPYTTLAPQMTLACQPAEGGVAAHYLFPVEGGRFEAADPLEDLHDPRPISGGITKLKQERNKDAEDDRSRAPGRAPLGNNGSVTRSPHLGEERPLGPAYSDSTAYFGCGSHRKRASFFTDEAYDFLSSGLWPHRIAHREGLLRRERQRHFIDFSVAARRSFMVSEDFDNNGRRTLFHVVKPGRGGETTGARDTVYGTRIVPPANDWEDIIAWEHEKAHSGNRATQKIIHGKYYMNSAVVLNKLKQFKRGCNMCLRDMKLKKSVPAEHIVSEHFGERILVDCKTVHKRGHIVVAVDHFTTYTWTMFVKRKFALPIAKFASAVMKAIDHIRRNRPKMDREGGKPLATSLYAANNEELKALISKETEMELSTVKILQSDNGRELMNKEMANEMQKMQVLMRHSRPYNPRTNGKVENRVKAVGKMFFTEMDSAGGLEGAKNSTLRASLKSATAILNHRPGSISSFSPFQAARHWRPCLRTHNGLSRIDEGEALPPDEVRHMLSKIRSQQAGKALYNKAKQAASVELPGVVKLQIGSLVVFYDPALKLKTKRLTGVIDRLTHGGTQAKVKVTGSNQVLTINCSLLSHHGDLDESTRAALVDWRRFKKKQVMARNRSPSESSCDGSRSQQSDVSERSQEPETNGLGDSDETKREPHEVDVSSGSQESNEIEPSDASGERDRPEESEDDERSWNDWLANPDVFLDGHDQDNSNTESKRTETSPGERKSRGPLLPNSDADQTCRPVHLDRWNQHSGHFNCMIPVFIAIDEVIRLPIDLQVTERSRQYFDVVAAVRKGMHNKLDSRLKTRWRASRDILLGTWPRQFQFPGVTPYRGDPANVLEALVCGEREDGTGRQSVEVVQRTLSVVGLAHAWTIQGCSAHPNAHIPASLGARFYSPHALQLRTEQGERKGVQAIVDAMRTGAAKDGSNQARRECYHCLDDKEIKKAQQGVYTIRLDDGRPSVFFAEVGQLGKCLSDSSVAPTFSVEVFGDTYSLLSIVYTSMGGIHFTVQTYLPMEKCWIIYDDHLDSEARLVNTFDPDYKQGNEYLFLYMRTDLLVELGCHHELPVVEPCLDPGEIAGGATEGSIDNSSSVSSVRSGGSPSGFKRKFGIGEEHAGVEADNSGSNAKQHKSMPQITPSLNAAPSTADGNLPGSPVNTSCTTVLGNLTEGQEIEVDSVFSRDDTLTKVLDIPNAGFRRPSSEPVLVRDLQALMPGCWITDGMVNAYFALLSTRDRQMCQEDTNRRPSLFVSTFFISEFLGYFGEKQDFEAVGSWPDRWKVKPLQARKVFFPHNRENSHWRLFVIDVEEKRIKCYDSLGYTSKSVLDMLAEWASDLFADDTDARTDDPISWEQEQAATPRQGNGDDCGVFMCALANKLSGDGGVEGVTDAAMPGLRRKLASQLLGKRVELP